MLGPGLWDVAVWKAVGCGCCVHGISKVVLCPLQPPYQPLLVALIYPLHLYSRSFHLKSDPQQVQQREGWRRHWEALCPAHHLFLSQDSIFFLKVAFKANVMTFPDAWQPRRAANTGKTQASSHARWKG